MWAPVHTLDGLASVVDLRSAPARAWFLPSKVGIIDVISPINTRGTLVHVYALHLAAITGERDPGFWVFGGGGAAGV